MNDEPDVLELLRKHSWHPIVQNAADEIERLRAENERLLRRLSKLAWS